MNKNENLKSANAAQLARIATMGAEILRNGGRYTVRLLANGHVRVSEYVKGDRRAAAALVLDLEGHFAA